MAAFVKAEKAGLGPKIDFRACPSPQSLSGCRAGQVGRLVQARLWPAGRAAGPRCGRPMWPPPPPPLQCAPPAGAVLPPRIKVYAIVVVLVHFRSFSYVMATS